jgi:regulator of sigma E protease
LKKWGKRKSKNSFKSDILLLEMFLTIFYIFGILLVLSVLILIHELGHFLVAKKAGVWVEEFGFGLPPRLLGKKIGGTIYSLNALPFGGFVRLHGETSEEGIKNTKHTFLGKGKLTRAAIVVAGIAMNLLLGLLCFAIVYSFLGIPKEQGFVQIVEVAKDSPAAAAGLATNDIIVSFNKNAVAKSADFTNLTKENAGKKVSLQIKRGSAVQNYNITLRANPADGKSFLGIVVSSEMAYYPPVWQRPFYGAYYGTIAAYQTTIAVVQGLWGTVSQVGHGKVPQDTVGPVGIFAIIYFVLKQGILPILNLMGLISINLAVLNILPIPALDGGRLFFIGIEAVFGKKVLPKIEDAFHSVGFIVLIALIILISFFDIKRVISAGGFTGFINSFIK